MAKADDIGLCGHTLCGPLFRWFRDMNELTPMRARARLAELEFASARVGGTGSATSLWGEGRPWGAST